MIKKADVRQLILAGKKYSVYYHRGKLYCNDNEKERFVLKIPAGKLLRICFFFPVLERMVRIRPRCAAWIDDENFIFAQKGCVYKVCISEKSISLEHKFINGMTAPLNFCRIHDLTGFSDGIVYGTYKNSRDEASIWHRSNDGIWKKAYSFPLGRILHIHNIIQDSENSRLLVLTGDSDEESGIWEFKDNFQSVNLLLSGSQQYRACVAFPEKGHILFATDTPLEDNYLYDYDEKNQSVRSLCRLPGPVIYSAAVNGKFMFSTSVEPDSRLSGVRYLFTNKLGQGVKGRKSHLFIGNVSEGFNDVFQFEKDFLPMGLCQFGNVCFPGGELNSFYICPQSVKKYSGTLEVLD